MPNYRGFVRLSSYRVFEFEADNDDLAWDHLEHLTENLSFGRIANEWEESGPDEISIEDVKEISNG